MVPLNTVETLWDLRPPEAAPGIPARGGAPSADRIGMRTRAFHGQISEDLDRALEELAAVRRRRAAAAAPTGELAGFEESMHRIVRHLDRALIAIDEACSEEAPLTVLIESRLRRFERASGIATRFRHQGRWPDRVPGNVRHHVLGILEEALHNVRRHAGARSLRVDLLQDGPFAVVTIRDDGVGLPAGPRRRGFGQQGMRERAALLKGRLTIDHAPGGGTTIGLRFRLENDQ